MFRNTYNYSKRWAIAFGASLPLLSCLLSGVYLNAQEEQFQGPLIVYYSRTNNTEAVANLILAQIGGRLIRIEKETPYPDDYETTVSQVSEENEKGYLPPLKTQLDLRTTDTLFLGFPTWGMDLPPPVKSFLVTYALKDKVIIPFNTHGGYGVGRSLRTLQALCPESTVLEILTLKGGLERDGVLLAIKDEREDEVAQLVSEWLRELGIIKK